MRELSSYTDYPNIKKFDDMQCITVILNYNFPIVSLYRDVLNNRFIISWVDYGNGIDRWVVTPIKGDTPSKFVYITDSNLTSFVKAWKVPRDLIPYGYNTGEDDAQKWLRLHGIL